ncbi:MAG TPA: pirin family protein [Burkholderiaceae bacterium]|jgi:redox-sensitive bicupin YhaK (pirin superfamily)|nr:pirin family protein [Burkholderiaceae bacterium]
MSLREIQRVVHAQRTREGGGFIVRRPFPTPQLDMVDPFLLLDEMGPVEYAPGEAVGAPDHPHRGFETVTYMLEGEFEHEDSAGHRGTIGPGDVQWMTAGDGVIHSEMPARWIRERGGRVHGFQLWVNLPARDKRIAPRYQDVRAADMPVWRAADGRATIKVIAGNAKGVAGAAQTRIPITYLDVELARDAEVSIDLDPSHAAFVYVFGGALQVGGERRTASDGDLALLGGGDELRLRATADGARALVLAGRPLREPVARYGPFVMNTRDEIYEAITDYQSGRFGRIAR